MQLVENWGLILRRAWSFKFSLLSAALSAGEVAVQILQPASVPNGAFAGLAAAVALAAGIARLVAQQEISHATDQTHPDQAK